MKRQQKSNSRTIKRIVEIQNSVKELDKRYFYYQDEYKRFSLKKQIQFDPAKVL
jgi:hypothetical protein